MKKEDFQRLTKYLFDECLGILDAKSQDYANQDNVFLNFEKAAQLAGTTVEVGIMTRIADKLVRMSHLLQPGRERKVKDETYEDTSRDAINYIAILHVYREWKSTGFVPHSKTKSDQTKPE